jgi:hypothetical protein
MDFGKLVEWIKLSPRHYIAVSLASGALLFLPPRAIQTLGLDQFRTTYRGWIGAVFILSSALLLSHPMALLGAQVSEWWKERAFLRSGRKRLKRLTPPEKEVLRRFIREKTRTQTLNFMDGVVAGLEQARILYRARNVGTMDGGFAYNLQPWAWDQLQENQQLLE